MRTYRVEYDEQARSDFRNLYEYIAGQSGHVLANAYIQRILNKCDSLELAPKRGKKREDIGPNIRSVGFEKRATILFVVEDDIARVKILGVFYGGREVTPN